MKRLLGGLLILNKYAPDTECGVDHDQIWVNVGREDLDIEDLKSLDDLGWFYDNEFEAWSKFV